MTWQLASIVPIWVLALIAALFVGVFSPSGEYLTWLPIVLAASVILTFAVQLAIQRKEGFVFRVMASMTGVIVVLGIATAVLLPVSLASIA